MKKLIALLLSAVMVLSLAACGSSGDNEAPVINGVQDAFVEAGTEFDAFAGVTPCLTQCIFLTLSE